jgi:hypothetical protein
LQTWANEKQRDTHVPDDNSAWSPFDAGLKVDTTRDMSKQELEECVTLFLLQADNATGDFSRGLVSEHSKLAYGLLTATVDVESLLSSYWMSTNDWVLIGNRLTSNHSTALLAKLRLLKSRVNGLESVQSLLQCWRQAIVCLNLVGKGSISTSLLWCVKDIQEGGSWRLLLI